MSITARPRTTLFVLSVLLIVSLSLCRFFFFSADIRNNDTRRKEADEHSRQGSATHVSPARKDDGARKDTHGWMHSPRGAQRPQKGQHQSALRPFALSLTSHAVALNGGPSVSSATSSSSSSSSSSSGTSFARIALPAGSLDGLRPTAIINYGIETNNSKGQLKPRILQLDFVKKQFHVSKKGFVSFSRDFQDITSASLCNDLDYGIKVVMSRDTTSSITLGCQSQDARSRLCALFERIARDPDFVERVVSPPFVSPLCPFRRPHSHALQRQTTVCQGLDGWHPPKERTCQMGHALCNPHLCAL